VVDVTLQSLQHFLQTINTERNAKML